MAFNPLNLNRIASGGNNGLITLGVFHYVTYDTLAEVEADGYFDDGTNLFTTYPGIDIKGDVLIVSGDTNGTMQGKMYLVTNTTAGDVSLTPFIQPSPA